jgi:hypothetical protein
MEAGTPLYAACAACSSEACGAFIGEHDQNTTIPTSWHAGGKVDGRRRQSHVSLGVKVQNSMGTAPSESLSRWNAVSSHTSSTSLYAAQT